MSSHKTDRTAQAPVLFIPVTREILVPDESASRRGETLKFLSLVHSVLRQLQRYSLHNGHATILAYTRWLGRVPNTYSEADSSYGHATRILPFGGDNELPTGQMNWVVARVIFCTAGGKQTAHFQQFRAADFVRALDPSGACACELKFDKVFTHVKQHSTDPDVRAANIYTLDLTSFYTH